jgi:hypothetical protein
MALAEYIDKKIKVNNNFIKKVFILFLNYYRRRLSKSFFLSYKYFLL